MTETVTLLYLQLYEMSDDVKRKEFLDELFTFMQKRGELVTCGIAVDLHEHERSNIRHV